ADFHQPPPALEPSRRLCSGITGLDALCDGGLLERSVTLVSGSAGIGKSTFGLQFILAGAEPGEHGLYVSLEEGPEQLLKTAEGLELPLGDAVAGGASELLFLSREQVRASQFLAILAERVQARGIRRLVLDGMSQIVAGDQAR